MAKFTNAGEGMRGINLKDGTTVWVEPGETADLDEKTFADQPLHGDFAKGEAAAKKAEKESDAEA